MQKTNEKGKIIVKNTLILYLRTIITMAVSLYSSRLILTALGIEGFGIYNIVGGIVIFFAFVNNSLIGATQRFINFAIGKNNIDKFNKTFSMCITTHILIAFIIFVLAETIGLYFLYNVIIIPPNQFFSSLVVFQISVIICCLNVIRTPYTASVIANERISFFAYINIGEAVLKLVIVYLLFIINYDKLILYSILTLLINILINYIYIYYCIKKIRGSNYTYFWDKSFYSEYIKFSGWSLLGSLANAGTQQGINLLINLFSGIVSNAAYGITNQVSGIVYGFVNNFQTSFSPQLMQSYASGENNRFTLLIYQTSKFSYYLIYIIILPVMISLPWLLSLWLNEVPQYTIEFCRWTLVFFIFDAISAPLWISAQAIGNIKKYQLIVSLIIISLIPISYIFLLLDQTILIIFIIRVATSIIAYIFRLYYLYKKNIISIKYYTKYVIKDILLVSIFALTPLMLFYFFEYNFKSSVIISILCSSISILSIFKFGLLINEKNLIISILKTKVISVIKKYYERLN